MHLDMKNLKKKIKINKIMSKINNVQEILSVLTILLTKNEML